MSTIEQIPQLPAQPEKRWQQYLIDSLLGVGGALIVTGVIYAFHLYPTIPNISIVYLLLILALAITRGRYAAILASVIAFLSFDFFLIPPLYTFVIARWEEWIALFVFLVTALVTSQLAVVSRQSAEQARVRERQATILYETGRVINSTDRLDEQLDSMVLSLQRVFSPLGVRECALLLPDGSGKLRVKADAPIRIESFTLSSDEMAAAQEVMARGTLKELRESSAPGSDEEARKDLLLRLVPLKSGSQVLGVMALRMELGASQFASEGGMTEEVDQPNEQATFFWTFIDQAILILERASLRARTISNGE